MTSGTIEFLEKAFDLKALEQAIGKSSETYIEPGKEVHATMFRQDQLPVEWPDKFKKPVVTIHEGKYVIIVWTGLLSESLETTKDGKLIVAKGFKAKFVTKYNFNQSKVPEVVAAPPVIAAAPAPVYPDRRPPQWKPNNGFQKKDPDGYSGFNRNNARRDK